MSSGGRRPLTPDTLPIIDRVAGASNVLVATGHGQLGVTTAATTAKLIAALVSGRVPLLEMNYHVGWMTRFDGRED